MPAHLLLVGCGKMGGALLKGWLDRDVDYRVTIVDPFGLPAGLTDLPNIKQVADFDAVPDDVDPSVVVFAVKPQVLPGVIDRYKRFVRPETFFVSIVAGKTIAFFEKHLGKEAAIVRAMPNTPAAIGRGITVMCGNASVTEAHRDESSVLMRAAGKVAWIDDEGQMDAVTAVSGSGPAYVFQLIETMAESGVRLGLPLELAMDLARETVAGAGELARRQSDERITQLRRNVTSPGGTTEAALEVLRASNGIQPLFDRALKAAADRSRKLSD